MISTIAFLGLNLFLFFIGAYWGYLVEKKIQNYLIPLYQTLGIIFATLLSFFLKLFGISYFWCIVLIVTLGIFSFFRIYTQFKIKLKRELFLLLFIIILGGFILGIISFFQGFRFDGSVAILPENFHDGLWHMAIEQSLQTSIPPSNPILSNHILSGYHYLTDFYWFFVSISTGFSIPFLYLQVEPIYFALLYASCCVMCMYTVFKKKIEAPLGGSILIFSSGFSYAAPFFFHKASFSQTNFWLDQPPFYVVNPPLIFGMILTLCIITLFFRTNKKWLITMGILLGTLVLVKVYAFLLLAVIFSFFAILELRRKKYDYFLLLVVAGFLSGFITFSTKVSQGFPFFFSPGWFVKTMFETGDHLNFPTWELKRESLMLQKNYLFLIFLWFMGIVIFIVGNLGVKAAGILVLPYFLKKKKMTLTIFFLVILATGSIVTPLLILQNGVVWSTIQFLHFAQYPLCILLLLYLQRYSRKVRMSILLFLLLLGVPTTIMSTFRNTQQENYIILSAGLIEDLQFVERIPKNSQILALGSAKTNSLIPAFTDRDVLFADQMMLDILNQDYKREKNLTFSIENQPTRCPKGAYYINDASNPTRKEIIYRGKQLVIAKC